MLLLKDLEVEGKNIFLRVDFNVPLDENLQIRNDARIKAALMTLKYLLEKGAKVVVASHLGRPKGQFKPEFSLKPVAQRLAELIPQDVIFAPDVIGDEVDKLKQELKEGQALLLENLRFYKQETDNDAEFARNLARNIDYFVNDAFGTCHRAHASVVAIAQFVEKAAAGFLVSNEIDYLQKIVLSPEKPFVAILGGAKVSDKIPVIKNLLNKADDILIGGAMAYTFFAAQGLGTGRSLVENDKKEIAGELLAQASEKEVHFVLPSDHVAAAAIEEEADMEVINEFPIPDNLMALDIGPETINNYSKIISRAKTVFWNGPMGVFEIDKFAQGTIKVAETVADSDSLSIVGGGDSVAAIFKAGVHHKITHISTGGGASLEYIANETLPGIEALTEK